MSADLRLEAAPNAVFEYEDFIDSRPFLDPRTKMRVKLAGEEVLDNIIRHAPPIDANGISIRIAHRAGGAFLAFYFRSPAFASFAARCEDFAPLFDSAKRRWRGIGLVMCRNLAGRIVLRAGEKTDRIFLLFPPDGHEGKRFIPTLATGFNEEPRPDPRLVAK